MNLSLRIDDIVSWWSHPKRLIGTTLLRVCLSSLSAISMITHIKEWPFLYGNRGMVPFSTFAALMHVQHNFSVYQLSPKPWVQFSIYILGLVATCLFLIGWRVRITSILYFIAVWSLYQRNPFLLDGGDNILYLFAFFLMFVDSGKYFTVHSATARSKPSPIFAVIHNYAVTAMVMQLIILYAASALAKISGPVWQNGTALYYVLRTGEFNLSPSAQWIWNHGVVLALLTYSTILYQLLWPVLIWSKTLKLPVVFGAIIMHGAIAYFMGLTWFSFTMMAVEAIVFSDAEYRRYHQRGKLAWEWCIERLRGAESIVPWQTGFRRLGGE